MFESSDSAFMVLGGRIDSVSSFANGIKNCIQLRIHPLLTLFGALIYAFFYTLRAPLNALVNIPLGCSRTSLYELFQIFKLFVCHIV